MQKITENEMQQRIESIFTELISVKSDTGTVLEKDIEKYIYDFLQRIDYFKNNKDKFGLHLIENDPLKRSIVWGLLKGKGKKTVVLLHHHDVVDSLDYGILRKYAYNPSKLMEKLKNFDIDRESKMDLESNQWIFARGSADMKAGAAIQLALIEQYAKEKDFIGNILLLSVPDEESLSAGMRYGTKLLDDIKHKFDLEYTVLINSEPHERQNENIGIIYEGTAGKLMPVIYVRGKKSHIGYIFEGINPILILSEIVRETELNTKFSDVVGNEASPPPSWSFCRDAKQAYDASIPESAAGYFSILTLKRTPKEILKQLEEICSKSFKNIINQMNNRYQSFLASVNKPKKKLPWSPNVKTYSQIYNEALNHNGNKFITEINKTIEIIKKDIEKSKINIPEATILMIEKTLQYVPDQNPVVVIAISPPYYPHLTNMHYKKLPKSVLNLSKKLKEIAKTEWNEEYEKVNYFMGLSDLSYVALENGEEIIPYIGPNMPLWGSIYEIPFETMRRLSIPVINIGPWGKDLHKITERVLKRDLYYRTPKLLMTAIENILKHEYK